MQRDLAERARQGDHDAFSELAATSIGRLFSVASLILRDWDRAQDAVQDALVQLNTKHRADRLLDVWLQLEAPASPPPGLLTDITARTSSTRPRPAWLARLEGHHVDVIQGGRRTGVPRLGIVLTIIGLLLAAIAAAAFF